MMVDDSGAWFTPSKLVDESVPGLYVCGAICPRGRGTYYV